VNDAMSEDPRYTVGNVHPGNPAKVPTGMTQRQAAEESVIGKLLEEGPGWEIRLPPDGIEPILRRAAPSFQITSEAYERLGSWKRSFELMDDAEVVRETRVEAREERETAEEGSIGQTTSAQLSRIQEAAETHQHEMAVASTRFALRVMEILAEEPGQ